MHLLDFTQSFKSFYYPSLIAIIYSDGGGERLIFKRVEEIKSGFYVNEFVLSGGKMRVRMLISLELKSLHVRTCTDVIKHQHADHF